MNLLFIYKEQHKMPLINVQSVKIYRGNDGFFMKCDEQHYYEKICVSNGTLQHIFNITFNRNDVTLLTTAIVACTALSRFDENNHNIIRFGNITFSYSQNTLTCSIYGVNHEITI